MVLTGSLRALWLLAVAVSTAVVYHEVSEVFDSSLQEAAQPFTPPKASTVPTVQSALEGLRPPAN